MEVGCEGAMEDGNRATEPLCGYAQSAGEVEARLPDVQQYEDSI